MGLSNASSKARNYSSSICQNQGGGMKKSGLPFLINRTSWTNIILHSNPATGICITTADAARNLTFSTPTRPIYSTGHFSYWKIV